MNLPVIKYCPGTLAEGFTTYSTGCLRNVFHGKKVGHILSYDTPQSSEEAQEKFMENRKRISISGVQEKFSFLLEKNQLRLTEQGEQGTYIVKPVPRDLKKVQQVPANEHLTMQIAKQVYGINTAENAMTFFKDGTPAYITLRFDVNPDGSKRGKEDFATLAGKTSENAGPNFKYEYNYEQAGSLVRQHTSAWMVEIEKYYSLVVFNYLFSNGDAHLKNFALLESPQGDYLLSPAYDLINTRLHVDDTDFALTNGLFADEYRSSSYKKNNHPGKEDFIEFGKRLGITNTAIERLLSPFLERQIVIEKLTAHSFLDDTSKKSYLLHYNTKRNFLKS